MKLFVYVSAAVLLTATLLLPVVSCVTPIGLTASSTPLCGKEVVKNLGRSEGSSGSFAVLSLYSIGRPDIDKAIEEAVSAKGGDALINVRMYQRDYFLIVGTYTQVVVAGDVIAFEKAEQLNGE